MKKTLSILLLVALLISLTGCSSLFSNGSSTQPKGGDIKISDTYTHKDPAGVEYATRYAFCSAPDDTYITDGFKKEYDIDMLQHFLIIYADKNDKVIGQYEYYVAKDEENAKKTAALLGEDFFKVEGSVCVAYNDAAFVEQIMAINIQYGSLSEATASAYAQSEKDYNMYLDVQQ